MSAQKESMMNRLKWVKWLVTVWALVFAVSGCVSTDLIQQMQKDIDALKSQNRSLRTDVDGLSSRLDAMAEEASGEPAADGDDGEPADPARLHVPVVPEDRGALSGCRHAVHLSL